MATDTPLSPPPRPAELTWSFVWIFVTLTVVAVTGLSLFNSLNLTSALVGAGAALVGSLAVTAHMMRTYRRRQQAR